MSFRVTQQTLNRSTMAGLQGNLSRLQSTQQQLSSGKRLNKPSDSPVDTVTAMQLRSDKQRTEQFGRNIDDGIARLGTADSALTQVNSDLTRVRQLVVSGLNGTNGPDERLALADEVDQLRAGTITIANTQYLGRPVFGGTANVANAFDPVTGSYQGNASPILRTVSADPQSGTLPVNVAGTAAFGNLLAGASSGGVLDGISAALRSGDMSALASGLTALDAASQSVSTAHSLVGARYNRLQAVQSQANAHLDDVTTSLANAESIDLPKTILDMQLQQTAYQASLGAAAKIIQPSLLDFLK